MLSYTEENYLKIIFTLSYPTGRDTTTNDIAKSLAINPASVSDMLKKLCQKKLIDYAKYQGVSLTEEGRKIAVNIVRKHRIWETFLVDKLNFSWDEVHEVAEQLEHIQSTLLIERLYEYLGFPTFDPHGEPIPDHSGNFPDIQMKDWICLNSCEKQQNFQVKCIKDDTPSLLQYLDRKQIGLESIVRCIDINNYDNSMEIEVVRPNNQIISVSISKEVSEKIYGILLEDKSAL